MEQEKVDVGKILQEKLEEKVMALQALEKYALEEAESAGHGDFGDLSSKEQEARIRNLRIEDLYEQTNKLNAALLRYKNNPENYGICENCGDEICTERLIALTETRHCVTCKAELEKVHQ